VSATSRSRERLAQAARLALAVVVSATLVPGVVRGARGGPDDGSAGAAVGTFAPLAPAGPTQVVVYDRVARTTTLVSHGPGPTEGSGSSSRPSISADGGLVAFESAAALVTSDINRKRDVYLWDRASDGIQPISLARNGSPANGDSRDPSISGDGGVIAFTSIATNMTGDRRLDGKASQVFAWQRAGGDVALVSSSAAGRGSGGSGAASVSRDGRVVAFESDAADLVAGDTNRVRDVFLRDLTRQATIRASIRQNGRQAGAASRRPSVSGNGGVVAFDSTATNLVPQDTNRVRDVFVRDLPPAVQVAPDPVDFGVVPLGTPGSQNVTVTSVGWTPVTFTATAITGDDAADFVVSGDTCTGQAVAYGATCTVMVLHVPAAAGPRSATLSITDTALDSPQLVALVGGVPAPQVQLDPPLGPPGVVTRLSGSNFPPGALVAISWDRGITQSLDPIAVNPDGTFTIDVLVFHHDRLGPRTLAVSAASGGPTFVENSAPFLVVAAPIQPTGASALTFLSSEFQLIVRR
jgi:Tol biopolymer transport system component